MLLSGILGIGVGIYTVLRPRVTAVALLYLISAWAVARGLPPRLDSLSKQARGGRHRKRRKFQKENHGRVA